MYHQIISLLYLFSSRILAKLQLCPSTQLLALQLKLQCTLYILSKYFLPSLTFVLIICFYALIVHHKCSFKEAFSFRTINIFKIATKHDDTFQKININILGICFYALIVHHNCFRIVNKPLKKLMLYMKRIGK